MSSSSRVTRSSRRLPPTRRILPGPRSLIPILPQKYNDIVNGLGVIPPFSVPSCPSKFAPFILFLHQLNTSTYFNSHDQSILCWHGLGSGKTITSVAASLFDTEVAIVFAPAALIENYMKDLQEYAASINYFLNLPNPGQAIDLANKFLLHLKSERHRYPNIIDDDIKEVVKLIVDIIGNDTTDKLYNKKNDPAIMNALLGLLNTNPTRRGLTPFQKTIYEPTLRGGKTRKFKTKTRKFKTKKINGGASPYHTINARGAACVYHFFSIDGHLNATQGYIKDNIEPLTPAHKKCAYIMDESQLMVDELNIRFLTNKFTITTPGYIDYPEFNTMLHSHTSNLFGREITRGDSLYRELTERPAHIKIILLSATPIVKEPYEFAIALNILKGSQVPKDQYMPYNQHIFNHNHGIIYPPHPPPPAPNPLTYIYDQPNSDREIQFGHIRNLRINNEHIFKAVCYGHVSLFKNVEELMPTLIKYESLKQIIGNNGNVFLNCEECTLSVHQISKIRYNKFIIGKYKHAQSQISSMNDITYLMDHCPTARTVTRTYRVTDPRYDSVEHHTKREEERQACKPLLARIQAYLSIPTHDLKFNNAPSAIQIEDAINLADINEIYEVTNEVVVKLTEKIARVNTILLTAIPASRPLLNLELTRYTNQLEHSNTHLRYAKLASYYEDMHISRGMYAIETLIKLAHLESSIMINEFCTLHPGHKPELERLRDKYENNSVYVIKHRIRSIHLNDSIDPIRTAERIIMNAIREVDNARHARNTPVLSAEVAPIFAGCTFVINVARPTDFLFRELHGYNAKLSALMCNLFSERITNLGTHTKHIIYVGSKLVAVMLGRILKSIGYGEISDSDNPKTVPIDLKSTPLSYFAYLRGIGKTKIKNDPDLNFNATEAQSPYKDNLINLFNEDPTGRFNILIINDSVAEGITLRNVNKVHLFSQPPNLAKAQQIIARAYRTCTHPDGGEITPFLYLTNYGHYTIHDDNAQCLAIHSGFADWITHCTIPTLDPTKTEFDTQAKIDELIQITENYVRTEILNKEINKLTVNIIENDRLLPYLRVIEESAIENEL